MERKENLGVFMQTHEHYAISKDPQLKNSVRKYIKDKVVSFRKTKEAFGELSNMSAGFTLRVNDVKILTSEALYQACRFPHLPEVQKEIIEQKSPMAAKMKSKPYRKDSRSDWDDVRIEIMQWALRVKLAQNFLQFGLILEKTYPKAIVEDSRKDKFWGAVVDKKDDNLLIGVNALGRLLMDLREKYISDQKYNLLYVEPLSIPDFQLFGKPIEVIDERNNLITELKNKMKIPYQNTNDKNNLTNLK
jgi:ribA/ribD-fused uncharacterized protein